MPLYGFILAPCNGNAPLLTYLSKDKKKGSNCSRSLILQ